MKSKGARLCIVVSSAITVTSFLMTHIHKALQEDYEVHLVVGVGSRDLMAQLKSTDVVVHHICINRFVSPLRDIISLIKLVILFWESRFVIVHSVTPKAGLLTALAGWVTKVPIRIHTYTGQVWVTKRGFKRLALKLMDRLIATLTTHLLADSPSQRKFLISENVVKPKKIEVIGRGGICGVDPSRFKPSVEIKLEVRRELGIPDEAVVLIYLGRLVRDKGVLDLGMAFRMIASRTENSHLLFVGPDEAELRSKIICVVGDASANLHFVGYTLTPERYLAAADIFVLPSYREGFGMVVIEAAMTGLPTVASKIYGLTDAVVDGETGFLHAPGDVETITAIIYRLITDPLERARVGNTARARALTNFSSQTLDQLLINFYTRILSTK